MEENHADEITSDDESQTSCEQLEESMEPQSQRKKAVVISDAEDEGFVPGIPSNGRFRANDPLPGPDPYIECVEPLFWKDPEFFAPGSPGYQVLPREFREDRFWDGPRAACEAFARRLADAGAEYDYHSPATAHARETAAVEWFQPFEPAELDEYDVALLEAMAQRPAEPEPFPWDRPLRDAPPSPPPQVLTDQRKLVGELEGEEVSLGEEAEAHFVALERHKLQTMEYLRRLELSDAVPWYQPGVPLREQIRWYDPAYVYDVGVLERKLWPPYILHRLFVTREIGHVVRYSSRRPSERAESERAGRAKHSHVRARDTRRHLRGAAVFDFELRIRPGPPRAKPALYARHSYMEWCASEAARLAPFLKTKKHYIQGNMAAQALFYGDGVSSHSAAQTLLEGAQFSVAVHGTVVERLPFPLTVWDFLTGNQKGVLGKRELHIEGVGVRDQEALDVLWPVFVKAKARSLFKAASRYLDGHDIDYARLQATLNKVFPWCVDKELTLQGNAPIQIQHQHHHSLDFGVVETLAAMGVDETRIRSLVALSSFVMSVVYAESWQSLLAALTQFCSGSDAVWKYWAKALDQLPRMVTRLQGVGDFVASLGKDLLLQVIKFVGGVATTYMVSAAFPSLADLLAPLAGELTKSTKFHLVNDSAKSIANSILTWLGAISKRIDDCVSSGSLTPIWGAQWNPREWILEADGMRQYYVQLTVQADSSPASVRILEELREEGHVGRHWTHPVTIAEYLARANLHLRQGQCLAAYYKDSPGTLSALERSIAVFKEHVATISIIASSHTQRVVPFSVYFYGQAGVGKTMITDELFRVIADDNGYDPDAVYAWQEGTNFQDGLGHYHWGILMDDIDAGVSNPSAGTMTYAQQSMWVINSKPMSVEQSAVELKGKVYGNPLLVLYCSNTRPDPVRRVTKDAHAFFRRWKYYVHVTVKPEFALNSGQLDQDLAAASDTHDMFVFSVSKYEKTSEDNYMSTPVIMTFPEFAALLRKDFKKHIEDSVRAMRNRANPKSRHKCCGLRGDLECGCKHPSDTSLVPPLAPAYDPEVIRHLFAQGAGMSSPSFERVHATLKPYVPSISLRDWSAMAYDMKMIEGVVAASAVSLAAFCAFYKGLVWLTQRAVSTYQGREANSNPGLARDNWVERVGNTFEALLPGFGPTTFTKEDVLKVIRESHVKVTSSTGQRMHAMALSQNLILIPTHIFNGASSITIDVRGTVVVTPCNPGDWVALPSNGQLAILKTNRLQAVTGIGPKMMQAIDYSTQVFDEVEIYSHELRYVAKENSVFTHMGSPNLSTDCPTVAGDCGCVYVAKHNKAWRIVAMHWAELSSYSALGPLPSQSIGAFITRDEIDRLAKTLQTRVTHVQSVRDSFGLVPENVSVHNYAIQSEILAATTFWDAEVGAIGRIENGPCSSTPKTKVTHSILSPALTGFQTKYCGRPDYWNIPTFRGKMIDGKWTSPYTNMFVTQNLVRPDLEVLMVSLCDYLHRTQALDCSGYSVLSLDQVIKGVWGSYINPANLSTAIGPPLTGPKRVHIEVDSEGRVELSSFLVHMIAEIEAILEEGGIPSVLVQALLKDEPIKPDKHERVFMCLPFAMNVVMKKYGAAWKCFMRANFSHFESAVGINMTSRECNKVVRHLQAVDPSLTRLVDGDIKAMDKSWSPDLFEKVSEVVYAMSFAIGVAPEFNRKLVLAMRHATYNAKTCLFRACMNPSGCDWTVELNGLLLSLCERYVYYREHPFTGDIAAVRKWYAGFLDSPIPPEISGLTFREDVALIHYGDDNLKAMRYPPTDDYAGIWQRELGMTITPAEKGQALFVYQTIAQVSFLKRHFVWDEELQTYLPPLDKRSIVRTLVMKKGSSLSEHDHAATVVTEALKEAVYHGPEFYQELSELLMPLVREHHLTNSRYLEIRPLAEWRQHIANNNFQTWSLRPAVEFRRLDPDGAWRIDVQGDLESSTTTTTNTMSTPTLAKAPEEESMVEQPTTNLSHETGQIIGGSVVQIAAKKQDPVYLQTLPKNELNDMFLRASEFASMELLTTDTPISVLNGWDPWGQFFANPVMDAKLRNYAYIRGTIQVIGVVTVQPGSYGRYVMTALPQGGYATTPMAQGLLTQNCLQTDYNVTIDMSDSSNFVMQLPFLWPYDWASISPSIGEQPFGMWDLFLTCLAPVNTGLPGTSSATLRLYVSLMPDYEIRVTHMQGKLSPNSALQSIAPSLHDRIGEGRGSSTAGAIAGVAESLSTVPVIGAFASTVGAVARGAETVLSWFGFTRDSRESTPTPTTQRSVSSVAHVEGNDASDSASLSVNAEISPDSRLCGFTGEDACANASLFQRWTMVATAVWSTTDTYGVVLLKIPVTPMFCTGDNAAPSLPGTLNPTVAGFYGIPFSYWRGDMEYLIMTPASSFHRGMLQMVWTPDDTALPADPTNCCMTLIHDLQTRQDLQLGIGYAREQPYLRTQLITGYITPDYANECNGILSIRVAQPLKVNNTAAGVRILVFARAKNMSFQVPRDDFQYIAGTSPLTRVNHNIFRELVLQGDYVEGALGDQITLGPRVVQLVPPGGPVPKEVLFGEEIQSTRALMQKPSRLGKITFAGSVSASAFFPLLGVVPSNTLNTVWTWANWYASLFTGIAASERYKVFPSQDAWLGAARVTIAQADTTPTMAPMTFCGANRGAEVQVPYYQPRKYHLTRETALPGSAPNHPQTQLCLYTTQLSSSPSKFVPYFSYGPDIRVTCFRQVPTVAFRVPGQADVLGLHQWWS